MSTEGAVVHQRVLVTGATGIVGSETYAQLSGRPDLDVVGTSRRGDEARGIVPWHIGTDPLPEALRRSWDIVVNTAADTRWSMTTDEANAANVRSVAALLDEIRPARRFIHLSTAHAIGYGDSVESHDVGDYRNAYEWSKAAAERMLRDECGNALVIRFPMVLGRRTDGYISRFTGYYDGYISRFTGYYKLLRALASGLLPAMVGRPKHTSTWSPLMTSPPVLNGQSSWRMAAPTSRRSGHPRARRRCSGRGLRAKSDLRYAQRVAGSARRAAVGPAFAAGS